MLNLIVLKFYLSVQILRTRFNLSEFTSGSLAPHANWGKSKAISHQEIISR